MMSLTDVEVKPGETSTTMVWSARRVLSFKEQVRELGAPTLKHAHRLRRWHLDDQYLSYFGWEPGAPTATAPPRPAESPSTPRND